MKPLGSISKFFMYTSRVGQQKRGKLGKAGTKGVPVKKKGPTVNECLTKRDYTGAIAILEFELKTEENDKEKRRHLLMSIAYCASHLGNHQKALESYEEIEQFKDMPEISLYKAVCLYYLQLYADASKEALT